MSDENKIDFMAESDIPDYMKILYGDKAASHMTAGQSSDKEIKEIAAEKDGGDFFGFEDETEKWLVEEESARQSKARQKGKAREKKKKSLAGYVILALAVLLLVAVAITSVVGVSRNEGYKLDYITEGDIVKRGSGEVSFVRRGETLTAERDGTFVPNVREGDKVAAGYVVGYVTDAGYEEQVRTLRNLDKIILSLCDMNGVKAPVETVDKEIGELRDELAKMASSGRLSESGDVELQLEAAIEYRNGLIIGADNGNATIKEKQAEREALAKSLEAHMTPITANQAGIVSFYITGNENAENSAFEAVNTGLAENEVPSAAKTVHKDALGSKASYRANTAVKSGDVVARVVTSQEYYMVMTAKKDYSDYLGKLITVESKDGEFKALGRIKAVEKTGLGKYQVVIKTEQGLRTSLEETKDVSFDISKSTGYCVPQSALGEWDKSRKTARIAVVRAGIVEYVYVTVKDYDGEFAIIENSAYAESDVYYGEEQSDESAPTFKANDCYVVNGADIEEGTVVT